MLLILLMIPAITFAQIQFVPIAVDYATFRGNDSLAFVEIYVSFFQGNLQYQPDEEGKFVASFINKIELSQNDEVVATREHRYQNTTEDTAKLTQYNQFVDIFNLQLPYGTYKTKIEMKDVNSMRRGEYLMELTTIKPADTLQFSDIELCSELRRDTANSMFSKNQLRVVPHPRRVFDLLNPMLYFYVEVNNLSHDDDASHFYEFDYAVVNGQGDTIRHVPADKKEIMAPNMVEAGGFNVMALSRNIYFLQTKATDLTTGQTTTARRKFFVNKPIPKDTTKSTGPLPEIASIYHSFSPEQLKKEFEMAKYLANKKEEKIFENLENPEAMKKFLTSFWRKQDKKQNYERGGRSARNHFMQLIQYANQNFDTMNLEGWETDRGRVLLLYGRPDDIERHPSSMDQLPYEIWNYYQLEGGSFFVFADRQGFGDYELIHSSYRKEIQNPNWQKIVNKSSGGGRF